MPNMVGCPRVLFNRELVMKKKKNDLFVKGDCDATVEKLCEILGWTEELLEQNTSTRIAKESQGTK